MLRFVLGMVAGAGLYHLCMQKETQEKMSEMYECASDFLGKTQEKVREMTEKGEQKVHEAADRVNEKLKE